MSKPTHLHTRIDWEALRAKAEALAQHGKDCPTPATQAYDLSRIAPQYCETHKVVHKCELMLGTPATPSTVDDPIGASGEELAATFSAHFKPAPDEVSTPEPQGGKGAQPGRREQSSSATAVSATGASSSSASGLLALAAKIYEGLEINGLVKRDDEAAIVEIIQQWINFASMPADPKELAARIAVASAKFFFDKYGAVLLQEHSSKLRSIVEQELTR